MRYLLSRRIVWTALVSLIVISPGVWYFTRQVLPSEIRIASGAPGGMYHNLAILLAAKLAERTGRDARVIETSGSVENCEILERGDAELAIVQSGPRPIPGITKLVPLYEEPVLVIARRDIKSIEDLENKRTIIGPLGSGMHWIGKTLFDHYRLTNAAEDEAQEYFDYLERCADCDAAIVTTGLLNSELHRIMNQLDLHILPVEDAEAIAVRNSHLFATQIPRGVFSGRPAIPPEPVDTVAATAILVAPGELNNPLIEAALAAIYETDLEQSIPVLLSRRQAMSWEGFSLDPVVQAYFDPYGGLGVIANFMESISAGKELIFALFATLYLLRERLRRTREKGRQVEVQRLKDRLDAFLDETVRIERAQMDTEDVGELNDFLDDVTKIKLDALEELTHEDLRGDNHFAIFLTQCANLIRKIQSKIVYYDRR